MMKKNIKQDIRIGIIGNTSNEIIVIIKLNVSPPINILIMEW